MRRIGCTMGAGLVVLWSFLFFGMVQEGKAQTERTGDLSAARALFQSSGYLTATPLPSWGSIVGTKDGSVNLSQGEIVYLHMQPGREVKPGDLFTIARWGKEVTHPLTHKKMGRLVQFAGELTILERKDPLVLARISKSNSTIFVGDQLLQPPPPLPEDVPIRNTQKIEGSVLLNLEDFEHISTKEFIIIDRGKKDGVIRGALFSILRTGLYTQKGGVLQSEQLSLRTESPSVSAGLEGKQLPPIKVGEAVVVAVEEEASTAFVIQASQSINAGDQVVSGRDP